MDKEILTLLTKLVEDISEIKQSQLDLQIGQQELRESNHILQSGQQELRAENQALKDVVDKLAINQENEIIPNLKLLFEGHKTIMSQLKDRVTTEKVEELESTVHILVDATKALNIDMKTVKNDIAELKQA